MKRKFVRKDEQSKSVGTAVVQELVKSDVPAELIVGNMTFRLFYKRLH